MGLSCAGAVALPSPSFAASITRIPENYAFRDPSVPEGWENLNWVTRGRASAPGDWEFGVTTEENINGVEDQAHWNWSNGEKVAWNLLWDDAGNELTFTIGGRTLNLDQAGPAKGPFNGFFLWTLSWTTSGRVDPGTEMFLQVETVNGTAVDASVNSSATATETGGEISKFFYASDETIQTMSGFARMSWLDGSPNPQAKRARDRVAFKIEGFYTGESQDVPEPASLLGLLAIGATVTAGKALAQRSAT